MTVTPTPESPLVERDGSSDTCDRARTHRMTEWVDEWLGRTHRVTEWVDEQLAKAAVDRGGCASAPV